MGFFDDLVRDFNWGPDRAQWEYEHTEMSLASRRLSEKYVDRTLIFTIPFAGTRPVQSYGYIDGMRFYFRYVDDFAQLRVGPGDPVLDREIYDKYESQRLEFLAEDKTQLAAGLMTEEDFSMSKSVRPQTEFTNTSNNDNYFPNEIHFYASAAHFPSTGKNGALTQDEAVTLMSNLIDSMRELQQSQWVSQEIKDFLGT